MLIVGLLLGTTLAQKLARSSEIIRDEWGVPHIYGKTDAACIYAEMVAQGDDNRPQLTEDIAAATGWLAEIRGEQGVRNDLLFRAFEVEAKSRAEYDASTPALRSLADAYAAGLNTALQGSHHFEPWVFFTPDFRPESTRTQSLMGVVKQTAGPKPTAVPASEDIGAWVDSQIGSNAWAIAPAKSASGKAMLFMNPHVGFFGGGQRYEVHLESEEGWRFSGFSILSQAIPHAGHNARLGWTHTNTGVDTSDDYLEAFDDPAHPDAYRYAGGYRTATRWRSTLRVKVAGVLQEREYEFIKTHHGPVIAKSGGKLVSVRVSGHEQGGYVREKYAMGKAQNLREFQAALAIRAIPGSNTTYADADGNIAFWYGNVIPRREDRFDWTQPVDGSDPKTEWHGYHALSEVPQVVNPKCGWVQNCNSSFWTTTIDENPRQSNYPKYVQHDPDTARAQNSRAILSSTPKFSYLDMLRLGFDTHVYLAETRLPALLEKVPEQADMAEPKRALQAWDNRADAGSVGATLYFLCELAARNERTGRRLADPKSLGTQLPLVVQGLKQRYGTWEVPWGKVNRIQRRDTFGRVALDGNYPSLPMAGGPSQFGQIFAFSPRSVDDPLGPFFGTQGDSYVAVVEFGREPRAMSIVTFGQSGDPQSPHFFDQAALYSKGLMKHAWWSRDEVATHASARAHPAPH